jgi:hypothetical protein
VRPGSSLLIVRRSLTSSFLDGGKRLILR